MATISNLRNALTWSASSFRILKELKWDNYPIIRSTYFAETRITLGQATYLLAMPLTAVAMHRVERFCILKRHLNSEVVPALRIMRDEMLYTNAIGKQCSCDILLEPLPDALPYEDALANAACDKAEAEALLTAIETLEEELRLVDISLNNLRKENILIDSEGLLRPIRWYHATDRSGNDTESFDLLRKEIETQCRDMELQDRATTYSTPLELQGHISTRSLREGLIAVEDESGWGFVDCNNKSIIEPVFSWVSDFYEGRAEVEIDCQMGLIDKSGDFIIEPRYDILDYDHTSGHSRALRDGRWHIFDYSGHELEQMPQSPLTQEPQAMPNKEPDKEPNKEAVEA